MTSDRLRVFLNASALPGQPAGAGVYTLELAAALAARNDVALTVAAPAPYSIPAAEMIRSPEGGAAVRSAWEQLQLPDHLRDSDIYHGAHFATPLRARVPRVATVHDLTFYRMPRRYSGSRRWYYRALARTATRAERLIVPSRAVAGDVVRFLGYPPERIRVVAEAPRAGLAPASPEEIQVALAALRIEMPYLLCVGTAEPGKRAIDAVRALALLRERGLAVQLVLAGNAGPLTAPLHREASLLGVEDRIAFVGYVSEVQLRELYSGAVALVFPSLYEGFGLPPLEAMACGTPVIATRAQAMQEVLADSALFVPLRDPKAIAESAESLIREPSLRAEWAARGREHAAQFSWLKAAEETVAVYRELTG
ncbi:MAG: glycosyltransferase family 1 protein [Anaerolineaceae bacterium]